MNTMLVVFTVDTNGCVGGCCRKYRPLPFSATTAGMTTPLRRIHLWVIIVDVLMCLQGRWSRLRLT